MEPLDLLLDTSILIKVWRGDANLDSELQALNCAVDTTVSLEFLQGAKKSRLGKADKFLNRFELIPFTPAVSHTAIRLIRKYAHSHGLRMPDSLVAAAAIENRIPLLTLNIKDFEFIDDINLI